MGDSAWAEVREAQLLAAKSVPNAGLVVTIDLGDAGNVHPARKREVGDRAATWALGNVYGKDGFAVAPIFESATIEKRNVIVRFAGAHAGLAVHGGELTGFSIAGADREFHHANARIEGQTVVVSSPEVEAPVAVRYDWADSPSGNLYSTGGLPVSPFRTDDWPGRHPATEPASEHEIPIGDSKMAFL